MTVSCEIEEIDLEGDSGGDVPGVQATCTRCQHRTESFGTDDRSIRRCLALMRDECPNKERNFYEASGSE
jgi:hypothetical protein